MTGSGQLTPGMRDAMRLNIFQRPSITLTKATKWVSAHHTGTIDMPSPTNQYIAVEEYRGRLRESVCGG